MQIQICNLLQKVTKLRCDLSNLGKNYQAEKDTYVVRQNTD